MIKNSDELQNIDIILPFKIQDSPYNELDYLDYSEEWW